jgi:hypothetical protein
MVKNLIDAELSKENEDLAVQNITSTETLFPFLLNLSPDERQALPKLRRDGLDFVERALMHAESNPALVSSYLDINSLKRDLTLLKQVQRVLGTAESFCEKLRDTYMELGVESYSAARIFYRSVKNAAVSGVEGCEYIARDLGEYYKKLSAPRKKKEAKPTETPQN